MRKLLPLGLEARVSLQARADVVLSRLVDWRDAAGSGCGQHAGQRPCRGQRHGASAALQREDLLFHLLLPIWFSVQSEVTPVADQEVRVVTALMPLTSLFIWGGCRPRRWRWQSRPSGARTGSRAITPCWRFPPEPPSSCEPLAPGASAGSPRC